LALDHRHAGDAQDSGRSGRTGAQNAAHRRTLADLVHQFDGRVGVAKLGQAALHGHRQRRAGLNGVQAVAVAQADQLSGHVQAVDATIGAQ
jgi:hypothetical protein